MRQALALLLTAFSGVAAAQDNVLLVVVDDVGVDRVRAYGEHPDAGPTPTLDQLAAGGVRFTRCWASPLCSPTRATILTGRYGFRTGIGNIISLQVGSVGLGREEWTLPEAVRRGTDEAVGTAAVGKWHLGSTDQGLAHPRDSGFHDYVGAPLNLDDYFQFTKVIGDSTIAVDRYATVDTAEDLVRTVDAFGDQPWFVYAAFHAAHKPYHAPPGELHDFALSGDPEDSIPLHHRAMVQALDTELGAALAGIGTDVLARTTVIVIGDNGTQGPATSPPTNPQHGKGTLFEGGVRVPLIVWGAGVGRPGVCDALVNATDLYATVLDLLGVDPVAAVPRDVVLDSTSLAPYLADPALPSLREHVYTEAFKPNHAAPGQHTKLRRALRGDRYKLVRDELSGVDRLYDLWLDPGEERDLLELPALEDEWRAAHVDLDRRLRAVVGE